LKTRLKNFTMNHVRSSN